MSHDDPLLPTQLDRLQRLIHHLGYAIEMSILKEFWSHSQETYGKSPDLFQPCAFICFHCCTSNKQITTVKKSKTKSNRYRCSHSCSCQGYNLFHKSGVSKFCTCNKPKQPLPASDHPLATVCGLIYDPMDPERPTLNKWLDNLESIHGTSCKTEDEEPSSEDSSDSDDSSDEEDDDMENNDSDNNEVIQPNKRRKITPSRRNISRSPPKLINAAARSQSINANIKPQWSYMEARQQLIQQRQTNWEKSERERHLLKEKYMHHVTTLWRQHSLLDMQMNRMQMDQDKRFECEIRRIDDLIKHYKERTQQQERELRMRRNMMDTINQNMKRYNITSFRLGYEDHDVISFDGEMAANGSRKKRRRSRRKRHTEMNGNAKPSNVVIEDMIRNKIRRNCTAWNFFQTFNCRRLLQGDKGLSGNERVKMSGKLWAQLKGEDKKKWEEMEEKEKDERTRIVAEFRTHGDLSKVPVKWIKKRGSRSPSKKRNAKDEIKSASDHEDIDIETNKKAEELENRDEDTSEDDVDEQEGGGKGLVLPNLNNYSSRGSPKRGTPAAPSLQKSGSNEQNKTYKRKRTLNGACNGNGSHKKRKLRR